MRLRGGGCSASKPVAKAAGVQIHITPAEKARLVKVRAAEHAALDMTPEGRAQALVKAAAATQWKLAATPDEKAKEGACVNYGLRQLEPLLANITLIDVRYLIALGKAGGVVPRWQDVPDAARIDAASAWRLRSYVSPGFPSLPILVLSYPWLDRHHPDKHGATLRRILPILRACRNAAHESSVHCTFGVFWDYMSLPQGSWVDGGNGVEAWVDDRSEAEGVRFSQGLATMAALYVHPRTNVLSVRTPIPEGDYENTRHYEKRGWCHFELRTASIVKLGGCLWDLSLHKEGAPITLVECEDTLNQGTRPPLTSPEQMATELREGVASGEIGFTSGADADVVIELYAKGFVGAFDTFLQYTSNVPMIYYQRLRWGTKELPTLVAALEYAEAHCRPKDAKGKDGMVCLDVSGNWFTEAEKAQLRVAVRCVCTMPEEESWKRKNCMCKGSTKFKIWDV
jgi:hypothetical protein